MRAAPAYEVGKMPCRRKMMSEINETIDDVTIQRRILVQREANLHMSTRDVFTFSRSSNLRHAVRIISAWSRWQTSLNCTNSILNWIVINTVEMCQPLHRECAWLGGVVVRASDLWSTGRDSTPGCTLSGDRLWAGKPSRYVTDHLGQLSLPFLRG